MMTSNYPAAILSNYEHDYREAYEYLSKVFLGLQQQFSDSVSSRFIEISRFEPDSEICVQKITEDQISRAVDMADCDDPGVMRKWFYIDDNGDFQPVTIGPQGRINRDEEFPFRWASSDIIAGGKVVGEVVYTDH